MLTIASLNTRDIPLTGSRLAERYAAIGAGFDTGDADVVCCQEVFTYWHLRLLVRRMRSFRRASWLPGPFGPMGGLVTFSHPCRQRSAQVRVHPLAIGQDRPSRSGPDTRRVADGEKMNPQREGWRDRATAETTSTTAPGSWEPQG